MRVSGFEPLSQLDTQEGVPTVNAVDDTNQVIDEDQVFSRVAQSDTETVCVGGSREESDDIRGLSSTYGRCN